MAAIEAIYPAEHGVGAKWTAARAAGATLSEHVHPLHGPDGNPIATDVALIGQADAPKLMIVTSGTHGVEAAYGSACQTAWPS